MQLQITDLKAGPCASFGGVFQMPLWDISHFRRVLHMYIFKAGA